MIKTDIKGGMHNYKLLTYLQSVVDEINTGFFSYHASVDKSGLVPQIRISERRYKED